MAQPEPMADRLYSETKHFLEQHVQEMLTKKVLTDEDGRPDLLQRYYTTWMEYSQGIKYLHQLYM